MKKKSAVFATVLIASIAIALSSCATRASFTERAKVSSAADILTQVERPSVLSIDLDSSEAQSILSSRTNTMNLSLDFTKATLKSLLKNYNGELLFIFARDGELLFDALQTLSTKYSNFAKNVKLVNISRNSAFYSSDDALFNYLIANGMEEYGTQRTKRQVIWLDTGYVGSIYRTIFQKTLKRISTVSERKQQSYMLSFLKKLKPLLLVSEKSETYSNKIKKIESMEPFTLTSAINEISSASFAELEIDSNDLASTNLPRFQTNSAEKHRFIVDFFEHLPHWQGRSKYLAPDGSGVAEYDSLYGYASTERKEAYSWLKLVKAYFSQREIENEFSELMKKAEEATKKDNERMKAETEN
jgi:hypothetical protein